MCGWRVANRVGLLADELEKGSRAPKAGRKGVSCASQRTFNESVCLAGRSHAVRVGSCFPSSHMVGGSVSGVSGFCSDGVGLVSPVLRSVSLFVGLLYLILSYLIKYHSSM